MLFYSSTKPSCQKGKFPSRNLSLTLIASLVIMLLSGSTCFRKWRDFSPVEEERPVIMFDCYKLDLSGVAEGAHNLRCTIWFTHPHEDTVNIDSVPIFVIDNFCFEGSCLDSVVCHKPTSSYQHDLKLMHKGAVGRYVPHPAEDLLIMDRMLQPRDYLLYDILRLPPTCKDRDVAVVIKARLVDRLTGTTIEQESKRVQFQIKKKTKLEIGN